jgi:ubiquinone/menaquinone biosynthesis C-methylase UbiE
MAKPPRTNAEWQYWGSHDPYFGVATVRGRERGAANAWTIESLRASGAAYFDDVRERWAKYGMGSEHCAEIGCGSGRVTTQLVRHFARVTAVDVSSDQLERAKELLGPDASRVKLALVSEPRIPVEDAACDGVFCCEVFQHLDSDEVVRAYFREAYRVLRPGGTFCLHVPVRGVHPRTLTASAFRNSVLRLARLVGWRRMMVYRQYEARVLIEWLREAGFRRPELLVSYSEGHGGVEPLLFATH